MYFNFHWFMQAPSVPSDALSVIEEEEEDEESDTESQAEQTSSSPPSRNVPCIKNQTPDSVSENLTSGEKRGKINPLYLMSQKSNLLHFRLVGRIYGHFNVAIKLFEQ